MMRVAQPQPFYSTKDLKRMCLLYPSRYQQSVRLLRLYHSRYTILKQVVLFYNCLSCQIVFAITNLICYSKKLKMKRWILQD